MRLYALAAPLALWLMIAAPFYCHHGLTTPWSGPQQAHQAEHAAHGVAGHGNMAMATTASGPALCPHQAPSSTAALAFASLDSFAEPTYNYAVPDGTGAWPAKSGFHLPRSIASTPLERPPSVTG